MAEQTALIGGRYQLGDRLGAGGMGAVYRVIDRLTGEIIALKRLLPPSGQKTAVNPTLSTSDDRLALAREFQTLASLRHPHIISVMDYGFDTARQPYFTLSLLHNPQDIRSITPDVTDKINLLIQLLQALAYLHQRGVMHRDLKPSNIPVTTDGEVKVLDFGLAVEVDYGEELAGTLAYLSPEILQGEPATRMADLYAVGVIAYEMFTGQHPFDLSNNSNLLQGILTSDPDLSRISTETYVAPQDVTRTSTVPAERLADALDAEHTNSAKQSEMLQNIIGRLLAKDPRERYQTANEVIADLCTAGGFPLPPESTEIRESFLQAARFVGREAELEQLKSALANLVKPDAPAGSAWLIGGESGVGKSRLLDELRTRALVEGALVLRGQSVAEGALPYQLWREALRRLVLTSELNELEAGILKTVVPDISALIGREIADIEPLEGKAERQRLAYTVADVFRRQTQPIVLILEDMHWGSESIELLKLVLNVTKEKPLLIVGSYRDDERPDLPETLPDMTLLKLDRFSENSIRLLSESILGEAGAQTAVVNLLQKETEGNAFFLVEVVRALAEEAGRLSDIVHMTLPKHIVAGGIQQIIRRRLNQVPDSARPLLKLAAVAGRQIDVKILQALNAVSPSGDAKRTTSMWKITTGEWQRPTPEILLDSWLTVCSNAAVLDVVDGGWRFAHDKLRETLLADLSPDERPLLHRQVAEAIESVYPDDENRAAALAEHWLAAENISKARTYAHKAGVQAIYVSDYTAAVNYMQRALKLLDEEKLTDSERLIQRAEALTWLGTALKEAQNYPEGAAVLDEALAIYEKSGTPTQGLKAIHQRASIAMEQGAYDEALANYQTALEIAEAHNDKLTKASILSGTGIVKSRLGDYQTALDYLRQSLALHRESNQTRQMATTYTVIGNMHLMLGDLKEAAAYYEQTIALCRETGDRDQLSVTLANTALIKNNLEDHLGARQSLQECLRDFRLMGKQKAVAWTLAQLGNVEILLKNYDAAMPYLQEALASFRRLDDQQSIAWTINLMGVLYEDLKRFPEAIEMYREELTICEAIGERPGICLALLNYGYTLFLNGNREEGWQVSRRSLQMAHEMEMSHYTDILIRQLSEHLDDAAEAVEWLSAGLNQTTLQPREQREMQEQLDKRRAALTPEAYDAAFARGQALSIDALVERILARE